MSDATRIPRSSILRVLLITVLVVATTLIVLSRVEERSEDAFFRRLSLSASLRAATVDEEIVEFRSDILLWSGVGVVKERLLVLHEAWEAMGPDAPRTATRLYLDENPYPPGERFRLDDAGDGSAYSREHATFQPRVRDFLAVHGYVDIFLVDQDGDLIYSYLKEPDFASNLVDGPWSDSGLGRVSREAAVLPPGNAAFEGYRPYEPSAGEWAAFTAAPLWQEEDGREEPIGVLAFQVPPERVGSILMRDPRQAPSARSVALGNGFLAVGEPPWIIPEGEGDPPAFFGEIRARSAQEPSGAGRFREDDGTEVLAAWESAGPPGRRLVVIASLHRDEMEEGMGSARRAAWTTAFLVWLALLVLGSGDLWRKARLARHDL